MPTNETNRMLAAAVSACEDKKAEDIRILALDPAESGLTDYFLICNGSNDRQNLAIADEVELRLKREFNNYPNSVEGRRQGEWILLDYVDFIVHVFSAEKRAFYGLERLRKSATKLSVDELNDEIKQQITAGRKKRAAAKPPSVKAPSAKAPSVKTKAAGKTSAKAAKSAKPAKISRTAGAKLATKKTAARKSTATKKVAKKSATASKRGTAGPHSGR
jgi:ribosome-associated protein